MSTVDKELLKECVYNTPLALTVISIPESIEFINKAIPYSTGFEIECGKTESYNSENFTNIPNIMEYNWSFVDGGEHRFRIPNGIAGIICLYNITEQLKLNCTLNDGGGLHIHIDFTDCFKLVHNSDWDREYFQNWILDEISVWDEGKLDLNRKGWGSWAKWNTLQTLELRVCDMTFEYEILIDRIIHANKIARKIKDNLLGKGHSKLIKFSQFYPEQIRKYILESKENFDEKLTELKNQYNFMTKLDNEEEDNLIELNQMLEKRIIKF